jgi:excisionase family DNA binding protein
MPSQARTLCLHAAARRLQIPERTLRYRAAKGRIPAAFKEGKLWKFPLAALEALMLRNDATRSPSARGYSPRHPPSDIALPPRR